jgi:hypothetical protein
MDYAVLCPKCRCRHVYFSHEVGTEGECLRCKAKFLLPAQTGRVLRRLIGIALVVLAVGGVFVTLVLLGGDIGDAVEGYIKKK